MTAAAPVLDDEEFEPSAARAALGSSWRFAAAALAAGAALAHQPVTPEHLREAPYVGLLFLLFSLAAVGGGAALLLRDTVARYVLLAALNAVAVDVYVMTRLAPFPQLADDVGQWWEVWGVLAVVSESAVVVCCAAALLGLRRRGRPSV